MTTIWVVSFLIAGCTSDGGRTDGATGDFARAIEIGGRDVYLTCHGRAAAGAPTIVLVDEVESMVVARSAASLSANPADVHRATDAVLMALDRNARQHPNIVMIATSNFTEALDEAFCSRADLVLKIPLPDVAAILAILERTLADFAVAYPKLEQLSRNPQLRAVATSLQGLDGRQVRKLVPRALAAKRATVQDPNQLAFEQLLATAQGLGELEKEDLHEAA